MTVLVPYDGSDPAHRAVEHAVNTTDDEKVVLLRVIEVSGGMIEAGIDLVQDRLKEMQEKETEGVAAESKELLDTGDVEYRIETAVGKPSREIVSFAEENNVTQVVIGSHGREGVSRVLLGNVAENVVRRAPTTVTVVR